MTTLLPMPQHIVEHKGIFTITYRTHIVLNDTPPQCFLYAQMLQDEIHKATGLTLPILRGTPRQGDISLALDALLEENTYLLDVTPKSISLLGANDEALCHAVQSLRQLARTNAYHLPALSIKDYPDIANRAYYLDVSRGRVPTLDTLKQYADMLCAYKINEWQLYVEHTYLFRDFSEAWRDETPLTAEDILSLDAYCRARHIELVPSLSTFGHMYKILSTKTFAAFCELPDSEKMPFSFSYSGGHHTLNVSNERALDFIKHMIEEYMQLFTSKKFNICADETFDLCKGRSAWLAEEKGAQNLYVEHVKALCEFLIEKGYTPMFWGDIICKHPETYRQIPKEAICLNWGYLPQQRDHEIRVLAEVGATQYACPGVCGWNRWIPLLKDAFSNIQTMCTHAHKYHAIGMLNTDWGDFGHINHPWFSIPGILYGAAFSWNCKEITFENLNKSISQLHYGDSTGSFMSAFVQLSNHETFNWTQAVRFIEATDSEKKRTLFNDTQPLEAQAANNAIKSGLDALHAIVPAMQNEARQYIEAIEIVADGIMIWNDIGAYIANTQYDMDVPCCEGNDLAIRLESWYMAYLKVWRTVSQESSVSHVTHVITSYADMLRNR